MAGIGDEDVDSAEGLHRFLNSGVDLTFFRDVHADANGGFLAGELFRRLGCTIFVQIDDDHAAAGLEVTLGDGMTDAAGGAGDEGNLAVELHGQHSLRFEIIVDDLPQSEREVGHDVRGGNDLAHRKLGYGR